MTVSRKFHFTTEKRYSRYQSPFDPCRPICPLRYSTPPPLYIGFQPPKLPHFTPTEALRAGTLWRVFNDSYVSKT